ncbi:MAG: hypothetical protein IJ382_07280 [Flavobacteriales bacterium]|nr:hypothetical protein [Flavobacteriales bacterium]
MNSWDHFSTWTAGASGAGRYSSDASKVALFNVGATCIDSPVVGCMICQPRQYL